MLSDTKWSALRPYIKSYITQTEQVIFRNVCAAINLKEAMNLKGSKSGRYMEGFGRRKRRGNDAIAILKAKKNK